MSLLSLTLILFFIIDPMGNIAAFTTMLRRVDPKRQLWVILREMLIALGIMLLFYFLGEQLFELLQISETTVNMAIGLILFLFAIKILFPNLRHPRSSLPQGEPFIIPLAVPLIASPSLIATIMLFAHHEQTSELMIFAILIAWAASTVIMLFSSTLHRLLGQNGLSALERLMAMILVMLAIQRFLEGVKLFVSQSNIPL